MAGKLLEIALLLCFISGCMANSPAPNTTNTEEPKTSPTITTPTATTTKAPSTDCGHGYNGGALFVAIIFGMVLMFGLVQLYQYWLKRRQEETNPNYRGY